MISHSIRKYQDLPSIPYLDDPVLEGKQYVLYDQLIVDVTNFDHPGSKAILKDWHSKNIKGSFEAMNHSENAELMLINLAIGKLKNKNGLGQQLW